MEGNISAEYQFISKCHWSNPEYQIAKTRWLMISPRSLEEQPVPTEGERPIKKGDPASTAGPGQIHTCSHRTENYFNQENRDTLYLLFSQSFSWGTRPKSPVIPPSTMSYRSARLVKAQHRQQAWSVLNCPGCDEAHSNEPPCSWQAATSTDLTWEKLQ